MSMQPRWIDRLSRLACRLVRNGLGTRWVVAVSGGSDSVGLLRALHAVAPEAGLTLFVAHLDHSTRGEAGRDDASFVTALAESLGLTCDLGRWVPQRPNHFESDARKARYAWLAQVALQREAGLVAVGQTRNDQAETILHRVLRGTGPKGLAGIPRLRRLPEGPTLVRPLLDVDRDEIQAYLTTLSQSWRTDSSNFDTGRTRARIRHDLLPKLAHDYNPLIVDALNRLAHLSKASLEIVEDRVSAISQRIGVVDADKSRIVIARQPWDELTTVLQIEVVRALWREAGWGEAAMDARRWRSLARRLIHETSERDIGGGVRIEFSASECVLTRVIRHRSASRVGPVPLGMPGKVEWLGGRVVTTLDAAMSRDEQVDFDRIHMPLSVTCPENGDRFDPLGMDGRTKPLADYFRGRRVPRTARASTPILRDATGIIWVVGHGISHRVRLTETTSRIVGLRWEIES